MDCSIHTFLFLSIVTLPHESSHKEVSLQWKLASSWVMPSPGGGCSIFGDKFLFRFYFQLLVWSISTSPETS